MRSWVMLILAGLGWASHARCQQTSDQGAYEGQRVASVEIVANPKISVESLQPLVQQRAGEAYVSSRVDGTISALKATGRFNKVEASVKPDPGGLQVIFVVEPALYLGIFDFPGAMRRFSYTRLLQVVDIPNRTQFDQNLVSKAGA